MASSQWCKATPELREDTLDALVRAADAEGLEYVHLGIPRRAADPV
jgi:hypothetical protein